MHFSHDPVGSCCERSFGTFCHNFLASGGMCNINHDGKMGRLFQKWNCRDIQSIPSTFFIRPNPYFAKDYTSVPLCKYTLSSIQKSFHCCTHSTFQKNRRRGSADSFQQFEILHVPRTYLEYIQMWPGQFHMPGGCDLADYSKAIFFPDPGKYFKAFFSESLEIIG